MTCSLNDSAQRRRLLRDVRDRLFTPAHPGAGARIGVEVEWIPWDTRRGRAMPILDDRDGPGSLSMIRDHGRTRHWDVAPGPHGVPCVKLPEGGRITFEPGGQIEYASPPMASVSDLTAHLEQVTQPLLRSARAHKMELIGRGIDPRTPSDQARLLLHGDRYVAMLRYLAGIGEAGPRMMLQTAALQVNVELGPEPALRWRVLNAAAPYLTAIFANSRVYDGRDSGYASFRARQWRLLDRRRTGVLGRDSDRAEEYLDFALNANWMFGPADRPAEAFAERLARGEASLDDWRRHLTTLFPEVRPRGFLEIRCIDALEPAWHPAPLVLIAGMLADSTSLRNAAAIVGAPDSQLLQDAARAGLADPRIGGPAARLFRTALTDAERAGAAGGVALETAWRYFETFTATGRSPGDEAVGAAA